MLKFRWNRGGVTGVAFLSRKPAISLKRGKIGPKSLAYALSIGAKINDMDDLEGPLHTLFQNLCVFRSPPRKFE